MSEHRLIDANALMEDINESLSEMTGIGIAVDGDWLWAKLNDAIEHAPTIEPERKTGKWVHEIDTGADMLKCSACECRVIELEYKTAVGLQGFTYCPYCGAKMESGK